MSDPRWDPDTKEQGLRRIAAKAVAWSGVAQVGRQALQFLVFPLLALMLDREDFGLVAMALPILAFINALNDIGARSALQREPKLNEALVAGVFWMNTGLGAACTLVLAALARPIAWLYDEPRLFGVLLALSPTFLLLAIGLASNSLLQRRLEQQRITTLELAGAILAAVAALTAAKLGMGPYSLVLQMLVGTTVMSVSAIVLAPVPVFARWRLDDVRHVVRYSVHLAMFAAVNAVARKADYILVGKLIGADVLGLYFMAYRLLVDPVAQASSVIARVALPVLAAVQGTAAKLREGYLKVVGTLTLATFPATFGVFVVRHELFAVLGDKWASVPVLVVLLLPVGFLQAILGPLGLIYQVKGRTDLMFRIGALSALGLVCGLLLGVPLGAEGVAAAYSITMMAMAIPVMIVPLRLIGLSLDALVAELVRPFASAGVMALVVHLARPYAATLSPVAALLTLISLGVASYAVAVVLMDRQRLQDLRLLVNRRG